MRPVPPGWGPPPRPGWGDHPSPTGARVGPRSSGVTVLVLVTILAALAAPHAITLRGLIAHGARPPGHPLPQLPHPPADPTGGRPPGPPGP